MCNGPAFPGRKNAIWSYLHLTMANCHPFLIRENVKIGFNFKWWSYGFWFQNRFCLVNEQWFHDDACFEWLVIYWCKDESSRGTVQSHIRGTRRKSQLNKQGRQKKHRQEVWTLPAGSPSPHFPWKDYLWRRALRHGEWALETFELVGLTSVWSDCVHKNNVCITLNQSHKSGREQPLSDNQASNFAD